MNTLKTTRISFRLPPELEGTFDICPGDTQTEKILGIIKSAFQNGYPGSVIPDFSSEQVKELEERVDYLIRFMQRVKDIEEKSKRWEFLFDLHHKRLDELEKSQRKLKV